MAYGMQVATSTGQLNTFGLNTSRVVKVLSISSITGSAVVSEFNSSKGDFFPYQVTGATLLQLFFWNNSTKTLSWTKHKSNIPNGAYSSNLKVAFVHRA